MSSNNARHEPVPPTAPAAFLRGIQRRATVLAELQTGDAAAGDAAVAAAISAWRAVAKETAMGAWPASFWSLLLSQPQLRDRTRTPVSLALHASDRLGELAPQTRAALLLRLAAGLDQAAAASVQGISEQEYLLALQAALPGSANGNLDLQAWNGIRDEIKRRIRTLPPTRLPPVSSPQEAPNAPEPAPAIEQPGVPEAERRRRWWLIGLWVFLAAGLIAGVAALVMPRTGEWMANCGSNVAVDSPAA